MRRPAPVRAIATRSVAVALLLLGILATTGRSGAAPSPAARLARGKMLVASDRLPDPRFRHSVVLLLEYDDSGALGVIVNRPTDVALATVLPEIAELKDRPETVFLGGPVALDRMILLVRASQAPEPAAKVLDGLFVTPSFDLLRELARGPRDSAPFRAFVGYAGWGPGQLDAEVGRGDWDVVPGQVSQVLTREPAKLWQQLRERAQGDWVRALPSSPVADADRLARAPSVRADDAGGAQGSSDGDASPPAGRSACRKTGKVGKPLGDVLGSPSGFGICSPSALDRDRERSGELLHDVGGGDRPVLVVHRRLATTNALDRQVDVGRLRAERLRGALRARAVCEGVEAKRAQRVLVRHLVHVGVGHAGERSREDLG